jgi:hypothetical protein
MDFSKLKKNKTNMDKLVSAAQEAGSDKKTGAGQDDRIWKPTVDKMGNGYAIIRFLPSGDNDDLPWARYWDHGFKGPTGQWLFEKSLTTLGQPCPISEMNQVLWNSGDDNDKKIVRERKRRLHYVANILVLEDPSAPDNEGKVFLYDFGKKIFDKIMDAMQPQYPDEKPMNPFDLWEGGDFVMKIRKVEGYRNYDKSEFKKASELLDGDDTKLEATCSQIMELSEFTDPSNYKTYEQLQARLALVLGEVAPRTVAAQVSLESSSPAAQPAVAVEASVDLPSADPTPAGDEADPDDPLSYFQKYAQ